MYADWEYWGKPLPAFGDPNAQVMLLGLAPAAHGGNRTGRMFTGDRSGDWVFGALHRFGFAHQPESTHRGDGQSLKGAFITAALRCAPPKNKPLREELANCQAVPAARVGPAGKRTGGGGAGADSLRRLSAVAAGTGAAACLRPGPSSATAWSTRCLMGRVLVCSYHPSQQNTQTGRLTREMFDEVFRTVRGLLNQD